MTSLAQVSLEIIKSTFEQAFADYEIPITISGESLREMIITRDISLERSVGCFDGDVLVGFILCGYRVDANGPMLYDGGTGVVPSHRGKKIASNMLRWCLEQAAIEGSSRFLLEVLEHNRAARELYRKEGFFETRFFRCFRIDVAGLLPVKSIPDCHIEPLAIDAFKQLDHGRYLTYDPSWQNAVPSILHNWNQFAVLAMLHGGSTIGFGIIHRIKGDIPQIGVMETDEVFGMLDFLIGALARLTESKRLSMLNVEGGSLLSKYLETNGWENHVNQYEMKWEQSGSK